MDIRDFDAWARQALDIDRFTLADDSLNGLQVGDYEAPLRTVAFAVDAGLETILRAQERGAQLLFVHHGLFWGKRERLTGPLFKRVGALLAAGMGLYACHLPLDAHPVLGNNAVLARLVGLEAVEPFGEYHRVLIGCKGRLAKPVSLEELQRRVLPDGSRPLSVLPFGPKAISTVGVISGGAAEDVAQAIEQRLDAYITGETSHALYHAVREAGINMLSAGHYGTEVHGVRAVAEQACRELGLETFFVDCPTGL
ncbi:MAG: Nif3-like dinuclear metal center hexameric protein [Spirochaetes bacterium GWD1_61_31]|nr:MAG: Nif3-like dinuclear metal center hexameric protein [Spirochaetes bacterium GWB1_60_80]OHD32129.1 MAG: Nif3-like dinuclear metal center hexameric protein [Spirochaetes bacterium GWC1_61_12]OHD37136.1 MAG: Nif3-like dinuclear metal center hexameric protein [Spirochaetes bacterium GWD1_61_31]OHD42648.1 MAG: Nif3-like dinuclear metal center hexameric protein [Spirochaetes bacterium GWE1_60_18]OHD58529.1 MAG: Nif3-like dinuclear metal center hexameric protein [Spirochaetes bacterium GWF1_60_